jgi:hypothetical protein
MWFRLLARLSKPHHMILIAVPRVTKINGVAKRAIQERRETLFDAYCGPSLDKAGRDQIHF